MKRRLLLSAAILAVLTGCNSSNSDDEQDPIIPEDGKPGVGVIPFDAPPYIQRPTVDSMTVRFELNSEERVVYYRELNSEEWIAHETTQVPVIDQAFHLENLVEAELNNLNSNTVYEYYIDTDYGQTPVYQFKTWPKKSDVEDGHVYKFAHYADTHAHNYTADLIQGLIEGECGGIASQCIEELASIYIAGDISGYLGHDHIATRKLLNLMSEITPFVPVSISFGNHDNDTYYETPKMYFKLPGISDGTQGTDKLTSWWEDRYLDTVIWGHNSVLDNNDKGELERQDSFFESRFSDIRNAYHAEEHSGIAYDLVNYTMMMTHYSCKSETWTGPMQSVCNWITLNDRAVHSSYNRYFGLHIHGHNHGGFNLGQSMNAPTAWAGLPSATRECRQCYGYAPHNEFESRWAGRGVMIAEMTYVDFKHEDGRDRRKMTLRVMDQDGGLDTTNETKVFMNTDKPETPAILNQDVTLEMDAVLPETLVVETNEYVDPASHKHHESHWQLTYTNAEGQKVTKDIWGKDTRAVNWSYDKNDNEGIDLIRYDMLNSFVDIYEEINQDRETPIITSTEVRVRHRNEFFTWSNYSDAFTVTMTEEGAIPPAL
ncbi:metallophosphoesterase [Vibrio agarivorans]|uniref:Fibronectin type III domain-containing protein n=1 Tax=Vibrio agarivorans TaxID=153622 RepID=A0ABT7Y624_9VIBR|nr:fibronectin type III domain-containing protein [Vibrio agarivorans]MDN2483505.1 fibronectin type III domain-containing protein [Vibrio agarivorans]